MILSYTIEIAMGLLSVIATLLMYLIKRTNSRVDKLDSDLQDHRVEDASTLHELSMTISLRYSKLTYERWWEVLESLYVILRITLETKIRRVKGMGYTMGPEINKNPVYTPYNAFKLYSC